MAKFYIRTEGVNLYDFIYDTNDLSTIRGGGLMMLNSPYQVKRKFPNLKVISTGASIGLFAFDAHDDAEAEIMRQQVVKFLITNDKLRHATFVVDVQRADSTFSRTVEAILAKNHWRQFQQPTVIIPEQNKNKDLKACQLDKINPGTDKRVIKGEEKMVSESVAWRRDYGKKQKHEFYKSEIKKYLEEEFNTQFVTNLDSLTADKKKGNLHHKMAVIYLDGNNFTAIRNKFCQNEDDLWKFDKHLKTCHARALKSLLSRMETENGCKTGDGKLRLETLSWGGDELIWVVPAWEGWDTLSCFYNTSASLEFKNEKLTYAGGIIFCHHNAPIHQITKLSNALAESAKESSKELAKEYGRQENLFQYLVLESFDHIGRNLESYREFQCAVPWKYTLRGESMAEMAKAFREFKAEFPRGQIYKAVHAAMIEAGKDRQIYYERFTERLIQILPAEVTKLAATLFAHDYFGDSPGAWLHLAELWDYIPEKESDG